MSNDFPSPILAELQVVGWHEGREIDLAVVKRLLSQSGIAEFPAATDFLREFHGLHFPSWQPWLEFDVESTLRAINPSELRWVEGLLREQLCPVGYNGAAFAFVTAAGCFATIDDLWSSVVKLNTQTDLFYWLMGSREAAYEELTLPDSP